MTSGIADVRKSGIAEVKKYRLSSFSALEGVA